MVGRQKMFIVKVKYTSTKRLKQLERNASSEKYQTWRKYVLNRDKNCCQGYNCGKRTDLEIHHIKSWAKNPNLRYNVYNGITLCKTCHQKTFGRESIFELVYLKKVLNNQKELDKEIGSEKRGRGRPKKRKKCL